MKKFMIY